MKVAVLLIMELVILLER